MVEPAEAAAREVPANLATALVDAQPALARIAARLCATEADARDLVQDTFERATRQGLPADVRSPIAWLTTMMHNLFIDRCRHAARRPSHEPLDPAAHADTRQIDPDPPEPAWARISIADIKAALDDIDPVYREVYKLHTFDHWSYEQIADHLSIQRITVGTRLNRARKKLREVLVKRFGLEDLP
jgi:RNA polymerase sigma-70 factor, ECF subfamily